MADVYCTDPECLGDYVTATAARQAVAVGRGLCVGCREAIAVTEAALTAVKAMPVSTYCAHCSRWHDPFNHYDRTSAR